LRAVVVRVLLPARVAHDRPAGVAEPLDRLVAVVVVRERGIEVAQQVTGTAGLAATGGGPGSAAATGTVAVGIFAYASTTCWAKAPSLTPAPTLAARALTELRASMAACRFAAIVAGGTPGPVASPTGGSCPVARTKSPGCS